MPPTHAVWQLCHGRTGRSLVYVLAASLLAALLGTARPCAAQPALAADAAPASALTPTASSEDQTLLLDPRVGRARRVGFTLLGTFAGAATTGALMAITVTSGNCDESEFCLGPAIAMFVVGAVSSPLMGVFGARAAKRAGSLAPRWVFAVATLAAITLGAGCGALIGMKDDFGPPQIGAVTATTLLALAVPAVAAEMSHGRRVRKARREVAVQPAGLGVRLVF